MSGRILWILLVSLAFSVTNAMEAENNEITICSFENLWSDLDALGYEDLQCFRHEDSVTNMTAAHKGLLLKSMLENSPSVSEEMIPKEIYDLIMQKIIQVNTISVAVNEQKLWMTMPLPIDDDLYEDLVEILDKYGKILKKIVFKVQPDGQRTFETKWMIEKIQEMEIPFAFAPPATISQAIAVIPSMESLLSDDLLSDISVIFVEVEFYPIIYCQMSFISSWI